MPHGTSPVPCRRAGQVLPELVGLPGTGRAGAGGSVRPVPSQLCRGHRAHRDTEPAGRLSSQGHGQIPNQRPGSQPSLGTVSQPGDSVTKDRGQPLQGDTKSILGDARSVPGDSRSACEGPKSVLEGNNQQRCPVLVPSCEGSPSCHRGNSPTRRGHPSPRPRAWGAHGGWGYTHTRQDWRGGSSVPHPEKGPKGGPGVR